MNKGKLTIPAILIMVFLSLIVYLNYDGKPKSFPSHEFVIEQLNELLPVSKASLVLDVIHMDDTRVFVPFVSDRGRHGVSFWFWDKFKWKAARIDTSGGPTLMKLSKDPSTYYIAWNINPEGKLIRMDYHLISDRDYSIRQKSKRNFNIYSPKIQKAWSVTIGQEPYGANQLPEDWVHIMNDHERLDEARRVSFDYPLYIGWTPYYHRDEDISTQSFLNAHRYTSRNIDFEVIPIRIVNEAELERPDV